MDNFLNQIIREPICEDGNCEILTIRFPDIGLYDKHKIICNDDSDLCDTDYAKYKCENNVSELTDFNEDAIRNCYLVIEDGFRQRRIVFRAVYDSDDNGHR